MIEGLDEADSQFVESKTGILSNSERDALGQELQADDVDSASTLRQNPQPGVESESRAGVWRHCFTAQLDHWLILKLAASALCFYLVGGLRLEFKVVFICAVTVVVVKLWAETRY